MQKKQIIKVLIDIMMTAALLLLMSYSLLGEAAHEWVGVAMFVLFILHHILNAGWIRNLFRGKYKPVRILQTVLAVLVFISMLGSMVSGIFLSRYVFDGIRIRGLSSMARTVHMLCGYWGFVFMSLHLGFHWRMIAGMAGKIFRESSDPRKWVARGIALLVACYGIYVFIKRDIGNYMLLRYHFVFFDFEEALILFLLDYLAVMGMYIVLGYCLTVLAAKRNLE